MLAHTVYVYKIDVRTLSVYDYNSYKICDGITCFMENGWWPFSQKEFDNGAIPVRNSRW